MKIRVGDNTYEVPSLDDMEMGHLIRIQEETGIGDASLQRRMNAEMARVAEYTAESEIAEKEGRPAPDRPDSDTKLLMLTIWMARLHAGEDVSWAEASRMKLRDAEVVPDEPPAEQEPVDPTPAAEKPSASSGKKPRTLAAAS